MALTAQAPAPAPWARWPQHHHNGEYVVMDSGMMPYEVPMRPLASPPLQRPALGSPYFTSAPLSTAVIASASPAQYQAPAHYGGYHPFPPSPPLDSTFKTEGPHHLPERPNLRVISAEPEPETTRNQQDISRRRAPDAGSRSPSSKSEGQMSRTMSISSEQRAPSITNSSSPSTGDQVEFNTEVDALMRALQAKADSDAILKKAEFISKSTEDVKCEQPESPFDRAEPKQQQKEKRMFPCDMCDMKFNQKTHLDIHRRKHTGDKPYICKLPGCGRGFSQLGNLKTHERRHTGEKPFQCSRCFKCFAQRGNVKAHMKTHDRTRPFICRLDNCNKPFTQLGNLKSHQNKFHVDTIRILTTKFRSVDSYTTATEDEKDLWEYFITLYKNSNKGIKGRGKDRKVGCIAPATVSTPNIPVPSQFPVTITHGLPQLHTPHPTHHPLPFHGLSHPAAYSMSRPSLMVNINRDSHHSYDMFDVEASSATSSASTATGPMYDEDHHRELAFGDRAMY
ncbi:hypothetical protein OQA88_6880 [Cercophora sp. LCS_1]